MGADDEGGEVEHPFALFAQLVAIEAVGVVGRPLLRPVLPAFAGRDADSPGSRIEGIGRPRVEPSSLPGVVDRMVGVPDAASVATMRFLVERTGLRAGPSTGRNVYGALRLACELHEQGGAGSIVTLMCDRSDRYDATFNNDD